MSRLTIPIQIDSIKTFAAYQTARCIYYRVEAVDGLVIRRARSLFSTNAAFAAGVSWSVLTGPEAANGAGEPRFLTPEQITKTLGDIYANEMLSLELGYIWVPLARFARAVPAEAIREGDVYRLSATYFLHCYRYVTERISEEEWLHPSRRFVRPVLAAPEETEAFRQWRQEQIRISRARYHQPEYAALRLSKK